jgi:hypothetical protein
VAPPARVRVRVRTRGRDPNPNALGGPGDAAAGEVQWRHLHEHRQRRARHLLAVDHHLGGMEHGEFVPTAGVMPLEVGVCRRRMEHCQFVPTAGEVPRSGTSRLGFIGQENSQVSATSGPSDHRAEESKSYINRMSS